MTWIPSPGLKYALKALSEIAEASSISGTDGYSESKWSPLFQHRLTEILANTFDNAIEDSRSESRYEDIQPGQWEKPQPQWQPLAVPNGPDPQPDGATMMGGHPDAEYHKVVQAQRIKEKVAAAMPKKAKPRRKKAKTKKAAKSASDKHSGDNPPTGD